MTARPIPTLLGFATLGTSWRLYLFYDHSFWANLTARSANRPESAWLAFVVALYCSMYIGLVFVRSRNAGRILRSFGLASFAMPILLYLIPALQAAYIGYALFGIVAGMFYAAIICLGSMGIPPEARVRSVSILVLGYTVFNYGMMFAARKIGFLPVFALAQAMVLATILACAAYRPSQFAAAERQTQAPFPLKLIIASVLTVFSGYFVNYFNQTGFGTQDFSFDDPRMALTGLGVRIAACIAFIIAGRRIKIASFLYISQGSTVLALVLGMLGPETRQASWLLYNFSNIVGSIAVYALLAAVISRYLRQLGVFSLLLISPGTGIVLGYLSGTYARGVLANYAFLAQAIPLVCCCVLFFILPFAIRAINAEVALDFQESPGFMGQLSSLAPKEPRKGESEIILYRKRIDDSIAALNQAYDKEFRLTAREQEIASFLVERYDYKTIAEKLFISVNTLKVHTRNIYRKFDIPGRKALIDMIHDRLKDEYVG